MANHPWYVLADKDQRKVELRNPERVAEWLFDLQVEALAGIVQYPDLRGIATAHLFDGPEKILLHLFLVIRKGAQTWQEMWTQLEAKYQADAVDMLSILNLENFVCSRPSTRIAIDRLKRFVAWQYRRELARRKSA